MMFKFIYYNSYTLYLLQNQFYCDVKIKSVDGKEFYAVQEVMALV